MTGHNGYRIRARNTIPTERSAAYVRKQGFTIYIRVLTTEKNHQIDVPVAIYILLDCTQSRYFLSRCAKAKRGYVDCSRIKQSRSEKSNGNYATAAQVQCVWRRVGLNVGSDGSNRREYLERTVDSDAHMNCTRAMLIDQGLQSCCLFVG